MAGAGQTWRLQFGDQGTLAVRTSSLTAKRSEGKRREVTQLSSRSTPCPDNAQIDIPRLWEEGGGVTRPLCVCDFREKEVLLQRKKGDRS